MGCKYSVSLSPGWCEGSFVFRILGVLSPMPVLGRAFTVSSVKHLSCLKIIELRGEDTPVIARLSY